MFVVLCSLFAFAPSLVGGRTCGLGLSLNVSVGGGAKEFVASIQEERRLGCDMMQTSVKWSDLEPSPGHLELTKLKSDLGGQASMGFTPVITIQSIDTDKRTIPADLAGEPWDSPKMAKREDLLLTAVENVLPANVAAVMLGNEVDIYFQSRRAEVEAYRRFLARGRTLLRTRRPGLPVGVTTTFSNLGPHRELIRDLQADMDIVSMTYYPLTAEFAALPADQVGAHFESMLGIAGARKLYLQEAGYPASELLGSSEKKQSAFVDAVFDAMTRHGKRLLGVCFFLLVDFNDKMVDGFLTYYSLPSQRFRAMLSTLGLKKQDGMPRAAWSAFKRRARLRLN